MSNKNSSPAPLGSRSGSRNNSLQGDEVEVTRQFLATNKKVPTFLLPARDFSQVITKGVAVDFPAVTGGIPICKDYLKVQ